LSIVPPGQAPKGEPVHEPVVPRLTRKWLHQEEASIEAAQRAGENGLHPQSWRTNFMKLFKKKAFCIIILILAILLNTTPIYANVIWPSIYIMEGMMTWWIIAAGIIIEFIFIKLFTRDGFIKSIIMAISMNAISALVGIVAVPLSGVLVELIFIPFNMGSFHISHWILDYLLTILCNASIESLVLKVMFKKIYKKIFWWIFCANIFTVAICFMKISKII
jgi:hypothetical protein